MLLLPEDVTAAMGKAKWASVTGVVPQDAVGGIGQAHAPVEVGDLALGRVEVLGEHRRLEGRAGERRTLHEGDLVVGAFGHRYAPDKYEGYAEAEDGVVHLLTGAGVLGIVRSRQAKAEDPTVLSVVGQLLDGAGHHLNMRGFAIRPPAPVTDDHPAVVAVVGTMMNAGKTTAAAAIIRGAVDRGMRVAAAKVTGTASLKDIAMMHDAGAERVLDFTACGWPSTYLCAARELEEAFATIYHGLLQIGPDLIVLELADGIIQRETAMLLRAPAFTARVDGFVLAANDALGAEAGAARLRRLGLRVAAISGRASMSDLLIEETRAATGLPCLSRGELAQGRLLDLLPDDQTQTHITQGDHVAQDTARHVAVSLVRGRDSRLHDRLFGRENRPAAAGAYASR